MVNTTMGTPIQLGSPSTSTLSAQMTPQVDSGKSRSPRWNAGTQALLHQDAYSTQLASPEDLPHSTSREMMDTSKTTNTATAFDPSVATAACSIRNAPTLRVGPLTQLRLRRRIWLMWTPSATT